MLIYGKDTPHKCLPVEDLDPHRIHVIVPCVHPSQQPKQHLDQFIHFCTAHGRVSMCFTMGATLLHPQNFPFPWGSAPHLIHDTWAHPSQHPK